MIKVISLQNSDGCIFSLFFSFVDWKMAVTVKMVLGNWIL